jgi:hypothetical protein
MRTFSTLGFVTLVLAVASHGASAQPLDNVMTAIRNGGGWVAVPIEGGRGRASTLTIPTMGITLTGCVRVWDGHSGRWQIHARETINNASLSVTSLPGQGVPFSHTFGVRSQLEVEFVWSEPRDTTLFLWVGVKGANDPRDACVPKS